MTSLTSANVITSCIKNDRVHWYRFSTRLMALIETIPFTRVYKRDGPTN